LQREIKMSDHPNFDSVAYNAKESVLGNHSPLYSQAINDSRFVKGFGLTALVYAFISVLGLTLLSGGIGVGVGLFIMRYDSVKYYRMLGIVVIVFAIIGYVIPFLGASVLSGAVLGKGIQVINILSKVENKDEEWQVGRKRALTGTIASGAGLGISMILMLLFMIGLILMSLNSK
jgi:hypothetical protein